MKKCTVKVVGRTICTIDECGKTIRRAWSPNSSFFKESLPEVQVVSIGGQLPPTIRQDSEIFLKSWKFVHGLESEMRKMSHHQEDMLLTGKSKQNLKSNKAFHSKVSIHFH